MTDVSLQAESALSNSNSDVAVKAAVAATGALENVARQVRDLAGLATLIASSAALQIQGRELVEAAGSIAHQLAAAGDRAQRAASLLSGMAGRHFTAFLSDNAGESGLDDGDFFCMAADHLDDLETRLASVAAFAMLCSRADGLVTDEGRQIFRGLMLAAEDIAELAERSARAAEAAADAIEAELFEQVAGSAAGRAAVETALTAH